MPHPGFAVAAALALSACGGGSRPPSPLPGTAANVTMCRVFNFTIDHKESTQNFASSLLSAGTSVSYRLHHDIAAFLAATQHGATSRAVADGVRVRHDCSAVSRSASTA